MGFLWRFGFELYRFMSRSDYTAWASMSMLSLKTLPTLATFSALKMLRVVHPSLVYDHFVDAISDPFFGKSSLATAVQVLYFLSYTACFTMFGILAFAVKMIRVSAQFSDPHSGQLWCLFYVMAFLNQVMGIVILDTVLQERVFLIVFGGDDADMDHDERALKLVYLARVARAIWRHYWEDSEGGFKERLQAVVMLLTFDHVDLQKLLIREDYDEKAAIEKEFFEDAWKQRLKGGTGNVQQSCLQPSTVLNRSWGGGLQSGMVGRGMQPGMALHNRSRAAFTPTSSAAPMTTMALPQYTALRLVRAA